jgi:CBS-domain-containing membrane protein
MDTRIATSLHTGLLIAVVGAFAWVTGLPALFPSLGPSAFVLAMFPDGDASDPRRVISSHAIGVAAGLLTYHTFAAGIIVTEQIAPLSPVGLRIAVSGVAAVALTVTGMLHFRVRHPPACATTLIVALGLLPSVTQGVLIVVAVVLLVTVQAGILRLNRLTDEAG